MLMDNNNMTTEKEFADKISFLRYQGDLENALGQCKEAIKHFDDNSFFNKIAGDILFSLEKYEESIDYYMRFLERIKNKPELFTKFSSFVERVSSKCKISRVHFEKMQRTSRNDEYALVIRKGLIKLICKFWMPDDNILAFVNKMNIEYGSYNFQNFLGEVAKRSTYKCDIVFLLNCLDVKNCTRKNHIINKTVLKNLESYRLTDKALAWVMAMLSYTDDTATIRALFRICRLRSDYSEAESYMKTHDIITKSDFNVQYELVFYYDSQGDEVARNQVLEKIDSTYVSSVPILKTLFKFYISFAMLDKAKGIENRIEQIKKEQNSQKTAKKIAIAEKQNRDILWKRLQVLLDEQEHNRQLLAITELLKGFSHELGQPITNIRYAIQLYNKKKEKEEIIVSEGERDLLDGILRQTERVGRLLARLSPLISSKNIKENFNVINEIRETFEELSIRLGIANIEYEISGDETAELFGEAVQFSQVFYNLIINSIYAIEKKGVNGKITVTISKKADTIVIVFTDNGIGIPEENRHKIFDPFFSTKRKEIEEGVEGLGLFIVWNILKIFGGKIYADVDYTDGARFVMEILKEDLDEI